MAAVAPSGFWSKQIILLLRRFSSFPSGYLAPERLLFRISVGQIYTPTSFSFYLFLDPSPSQLEKKELSSSSVSSLTGLPFLSLSVPRVAPPGGGGGTSPRPRVAACEPAQRRRLIADVRAGHDDAQGRRSIGPGCCRHRRGCTPRCCLFSPARIYYCAP